MIGKKGSISKDLSMKQTDELKCWRKHITMDNLRAHLYNS